MAFVQTLLLMLLLPFTTTTLQRKTDLISSLPFPSPSSPSPYSPPSPLPSPTPSHSSPPPSPSPSPYPLPSPSPSPSPLVELGRVLVSKDGNGNFNTIADAINYAPNNSNNGYFVIHVNEGIYEEYITIPVNKIFLHMEGDGMNKTIITGNRSVVDGWNTMTTATFTVQGKGFFAKNITFRNTAGSAKQQAVAVLNQADQSTFYKCAFEGYQDTLFAKDYRQFYRDCKIYGTLDFIFGDAAAIYQNCEIYVRLPCEGQYNVITAQGREDPTHETGIVIQNCSIHAAPELTSNVKTYLGRPWKNYSRAIFSQSFIDDFINPLGWIQMQDQPLFEDTLFYGEFNNTGSGSNTNGRVKWHGYHVMKVDQDMMNFTVSNFLNGDEWLPMTGIPYDRGLI